MKKSFLKPTLILFNILLVSLITDTTLYAQEARPAGQGINFNCSNEYGIFEDNEDIAALLHQLYLAKGGCESEYVHEMIDKLTFFYITNRESVEEDILNQVIQLIIALDINNVLISSYNETIESLILQYLSIDNPLFSIAVAQEIVRLMILNPEWPMVWVVSTAFMNVMVEGVHVILDGVGLIPGAGEIFDVINGTLYAIEGDWTSAAFSFGATVPFLGWFSTTAKFATRPIAGRKFLLVWKKSADGTKVLFASDNALRSQLRGILNTPSGSVAHHIIPLEFLDDDLIQAAAKAGPAPILPWHPNELENGINILQSLHPGSHPNYSSQILARINTIKVQIGSPIDPAIAVEKLRTLADEVKFIIKSNPNTPINEIIF